MAKVSLQKLLDKNLTEIGRVDGIIFYGHPYLGGDTGLIAVYNGEAVTTDWYDLPSHDEIEDADDFIDCYRS